MDAVLPHGHLQIQTQQLINRGCAHGWHGCAVEELRNDGRAVVLVGDLNIVADAQADSHPGK